MEKYDRADADKIEASPNIGTLRMLEQAMAEYAKPDRRATKRAAVLVHSAYMAPSLKAGLLLTATQYAGVHEALQDGAKTAAYNYWLGFALEDREDESPLSPAEQQLVDNISDDELRRAIDNGDIFADLAHIWALITRGVKYARAKRAVELLGSNEDVNDMLCRHEAKHDYKFRSK